MGAPNWIGRYTLLQSSAEIGIGNLVHTFGIPLGGHLLSLNQALILTFVSRRMAGRIEAMKASTGVANATALLKVLSPMGQRLTPMLAISVQGVLFSSAIGLLGNNLGGAILGSMLLSLWGFLQPLLLAYVLFGKIFFEALAKIWTELAQSLSLSVSMGPRLLVSLVLIKLILSAAIVAAAWFSSEKFEEKYSNKVDQLRRRLPCQTDENPESQPAGRAILGAIKDLFRPWFVASLALSVLYFWFSGPQGSSLALIYVLKTCAVALAVFWLVRALPRKWLASAVQKQS